MAELTKEWLKQTIAEYEANRDELPFGLDTNSAIELQAFKLALASLEAEPVVWLLSGGGAKNHVSFDSGNAYADPLREVTPLYTAPPAPVSVPDAISTRQAIAKMENHEPCDSINVAYKFGWNACRAAMLNHSENERDMVELVSQPYKLPERVTNALTLSLQAMEFMGDTLNNLDAVCKEDVEFVAPAFEAVRAALAGNSPVIPDGWVACSEQMPEDEQEVIVQNKMGYRYVSYFDEHSGLFFDMRGGNQMNCIEHIFVTHWMPLPAAPQQEAVSSALEHGMARYSGAMQKLADGGD